MSGLAVACAFFIGGAAYGANSPLGTWDFTLSGAKLGSAYLTFNPDGSITGYIIESPTTGVQTGGINSHPLGFGYAQLSGMWQPDGNQVVGFLANPPTDAMRLDITSFTGTVSNNLESFAIAGVTENGNVTLSGAPFVQSQTLPQVWTIEMTTQGGRLIFTEIFNATPDQTIGGGNLYDLVGQGSDICVFGYGALSKGVNFNVSITQYQMPAGGDCSSLDTSSATGTMSAGTGRINPRTFTANLSGFQDGSTTSRVSMPVICQEQ